MYESMSRVSSVNLVDKSVVGSVGKNMARSLAEETGPSEAWNPFKI